MKIHLFKFLKFGLFFTGLVNLNACVSVDIAPKSAVHAENFEYKPPTEPFEKKEQTGADISWQSKNTGNTLAVVTDCSPSAGDLNLETIQNDFYQSLSQSKILDSKIKIWNSREALFSNGEGKLDGVSVKLSFVVLSKNSCIYTLSFVGSAKNFTKEKTVFEKFIQEFEVP